MRRLAIVVILSCLLVSCAKKAEPEQDLLRFLSATQDAPRSFLYEDKTTKDGDVIVTGKVQDDLNVQAKLTVDGGEVLEEVISADALAVHVMDQSKLPALQSGPVGGSRIVGDALRSGRWVVDYAGAPPLIAQRTREGSILVGEKPLLDALYLFQYLRRAIDEADHVQIFNKDALDYIPSEDPFPPSKPEAGIQRYDLVPPALPRKSARGTAAGLPGTAHFRKMAFYVKARHLIEVREKIDFESHRDFRRAREGRGPKYPLTLLAAVRAGKAREPIRVRSMEFRLSNLGDEKIKVVLPTDFLAANLVGVFGPTGLISQGQTDTTVQPGEPSEPSPSADTTATSTAGG